MEQITKVAKERAKGLTAEAVVAEILATLPMPSPV